MKIIDVRTKEEYDDGHITDAILLDIKKILQGVALDLDKKEEIVLYCRSGSRSMMAKIFLGMAGFTNVINGGGIYDLSEKLKLKIQK